MKQFNYDIHSQSSRSRARTGTITTPHGSVKTPGFVTVGTKGTVKSLSPEDLDTTGTQFVFVNTYHIVISPGADIVQEHGGIHKMSSIECPIITDSGGFQVFSLGRKDKEKKEAKKKRTNWNEKQDPSIVKIHEDGVDFRSHLDGTLIKFTPEFSIDTQKKIGADCIIAFDEDILNKASHSYTQESTERTHRWLDRCIAEFNKDTGYGGPEKQKMYGVIHGGAFDDLRTQSTQYILDSDVWGVAMGGVSVGAERKQLRHEVDLVGEVLGDDPRPRHLLGIGTFDEVIHGVKSGFDTFDCVLPTRDARIGQLYQRTGERDNGIGIYEKFDITKSTWKNRVEPVNEEVLGTTTYAYLHHLYKQRELLAYRLGSIHNLFIMEQFFAEIRKAVQEDRL